MLRKHSAASNVSRRMSPLSFFRLASPNSPSSDPGSHRVSAEKIRSYLPDTCGADSIAVAEPVPMVSTSVVAALASVTLIGLKLHVAFDGSVPHDSERTTVYHPAGVSVSVVVPVDPRVMVSDNGFAVTAKP